MAVIHMHQIDGQPDASFRIAGHDDDHWIEISRGSDGIFLFFSDEDTLNRLLGLIQTEIYAYQREKE